MTKKYTEPIVLLGGGEGLKNIGHLLRDFVTDLTLIASAFDNGGHTKVLRLQGHVGLGDLRKAIEALADERILRNTEFGRYFTRRFPGKKDSTLLESGGNHVLAELTEKYGMGEGLLQALQEVSEKLGVKGRVLPVSLDNAHLRSIASATQIATEGHLDGRSPTRHPIMCGILTPRPHICPATAEAIRRAKLIVATPGTLWASVLVNPMVGGVGDTTKESIVQGGKVVMITNLVSRKNEVSDEDNNTVYFVNLLCAQLGLEKIHAVLGNVGKFPPHILKKYAVEHARPVVFKKTNEAELNISGNFASWDDKGIVRHNQKTIERLLEL